MCHNAGLYQIDLLNGSKTRVTEREYWARKKGQLALDAENATLAEQGLPIKQSKFETDKEKLRQIIRKALETATSFDKFSELLLRQGVSVKESRGRLSYLTADRTKPITARKLGDDFDKIAVFTTFAENAKMANRKSTQVHHAPDSISRMVDMDVAAAKGKGYENWAKIHNLKNASIAYRIYQESGFVAPEELDAAYHAAHTEIADIRKKLNSIETEIKEKKVFRNHLTGYFKTKYLVAELKACKNEKARQKYRDEHEDDFLILNAAKRYFDSKGLKKLPSYKALQSEVEQLIKEKNALYNRYHEAKEKEQQLSTIRHNIEQLRNNRTDRTQEQER